MRQNARRTYAKASSRRAVALLCQHISNRYFPETQGDQRTIRITEGFSGDQWIMVHPQGWDWWQEAQRWDPKKTERLYRLTPEKLRHAYRTLAFAQAHCDPIEQWYQLVKFVSLTERQKLKGDALRAETLRAGAHMIRLLHQELYGEELPHPNEVHGNIRAHRPELEVRRDVRRYLEMVSNRFGVNPQPKLALIVEGESEEYAVTQIFEEYFGAHPGVYSIEIITLGGVDKATGTKEDRFRAILRLIDYLHHHQTITFLILDDENYASRLKREAEEAKSIHDGKRYVTRPDHIHIWKKSFEFDNFSCTEIARALNELAKEHARFTEQEVIQAKKHRITPGSQLKQLYRGKIKNRLPKVELSKILIQIALSPAAELKIEDRPIVEILSRVECLASRNPLPSTLRAWKESQSSGHLGEMIKPEDK